MEEGGNDAGVCSHADARITLPGVPRSGAAAAKAKLVEPRSDWGGDKHRHGDALLSGGRSGWPSLQDIRLPGRRYIMQAGYGVISSSQAAAVSVASVSMSASGGFRPRPLRLRT